MDQAMDMGMDWVPYDKKMLPTEAQEQATLMSWAQMQSFRYPELRLLFHIPNGGGRSKAEAGRFKAEGVKPGVPDLLLPAARGKYHGIFIEMKRMAGAGGKASPDQKKWIADLREQGYAAEVCFGWKQAAEVLTAYLELAEG